MQSDTEKNNVVRPTQPYSVEEEPPGVEVGLELERFDVFTTLTLSHCWQAN